MFKKATSSADWLGNVEAINFKEQTGHSKITLVVMK